MDRAWKWYWLAAGLFIGSLFYLLAPVLTPFLIAAILAYIGDPFVDRLEKRGLSRSLSVTSVFILLTLGGLAVLLVLLPLLYQQLALLVSKLPAYVEWLQDSVLPWARERMGMGMDLGSLADTIRENWGSAGGAVAGAVGMLSRSGITVLGWLVNLVLVPVVTFYLLRDWDVLMGRLQEMLPRRVEAETVRVAASVDEVLGAFLRGQLAVMFVLGAIYSAGLWLVGIDLALLIGMMAGLVSFVPYLGSIVGIATAGIAGAVQFQEWLPLVWVAVVFGVGQLVEATVLTPLLLGDRIGLHPVMVIFAVLAGGRLFGFFGVLLALPVAAVVAVLVRYAHEKYLRSHLYSAEGDGP